MNARKAEDEVGFGWVAVDEERRKQSVRKVHKAHPICFTQPGVFREMFNPVSWINGCLQLLGRRAQNTWLVIKG